MQCDYFGRCGSCRNYEGGYGDQLKRKIALIRSEFAPFHDGDISVFASPETHYRARSEFRIWHEGEAIRYAMHGIEKGSIVTIDACPKVVAPIAELMPRLLASLEGTPMANRLFGADFLAAGSGEVAVSLLYHRQLDDAWEEEARRLGSALGIHIIGRSRKQKRVVGQEYVTETLTIAGREYRFEQVENSFTQPNPRVNEQMVTWALNCVEGIGGDLLELYCGAGNFTIPFASRFERVLATEISKSSIHAAKRNMVLNGVANVDFVRMSAEEFVAALDGVREFNRMRGIDLSDYRLKTLFVDPPRAGMDASGCDFAARFDHLVYISCNPETLRRDLERMSGSHEVAAMALFDQFPYTDHLEMGVMLRRKEPS